MGYTKSNENREMARKALSNIVVSGGQCTDNLELCQFCPLRMIATRADGSPSSCLAAVLGTNRILDISAATLTATNAKFLQIAQKLLADMAIEDMLEEQDDR